MEVEEVLAAVKTTYCTNDRLQHKTNKTFTTFKEDANELVKETIKQVYQTDNVAEGIMKLLDDEVCEKLAAAGCPIRAGKRPSVEELLALKDRLGISDVQWMEVVQTFGLEKYGTTHKLRQHRHALDNTLPVLPTSTSGQGYHIPLRDYLEWHLQQSPPGSSPSSTPLLLKLAFDGATITKKKRTQQELGGFQFIRPQEPLSSIKSPRNCHVWLVYIGGESAEELRHELQSTIEAVHHIVTDMKLITNGKEWAIKPILTCDLKCLMKMMGLYDVFHPKSKSKCPFCTCNDTEIDDFTKEEWPFHKEEYRQKWAEEVERRQGSGKRTYAKTHHGVIAAPIFNLPLTQIVPCNLHAIMAILKKLLHLVTVDVQENPQVIAALEEVLLTKCDVKVMQSEKMTFVQRIQGSRLDRPDCLHILGEYKALFAVLKAATQDPEDLQKFGKAEGVWDHFYPLACLAAQAHVQITEKEWLSRAREFGKAFVNAYQSEDVTTYMHIFVYHFGFYLETYNGIEKFANFALEGKHGTVKKILKQNTSGFTYGPGETARQQLCGLLRREVHDATRAPAPPSKKTSWAESILPDHPSIQRFVVSSKICI